MKQENNRTNDNLIIGRNAVLELLKSDREVENVLIAKGEREGSINRIIALCKEKKIVIFKYKQKKGSTRRKQGHRQPYTKLTVESIAA